MEANKTDAEDCIRTAKRAAAEGNLDKAIRFLEKSIKLYPTELAKSESLKSIYKQNKKINKKWKFLFSLFNFPKF